MTSLAQRVLSSSGAMLVIRFTQRGIGLISTLILARLLTPDDFGMVAIVALVIQLFDVVATTGSAQYIIQKSDLEDDDLDTAWTIDILMKVGLQLILIASAPLVAQFYDEPALKQALWLASFSLPISALLNPGLILLKKELTYRPILRLSILQKLLSFAAVMIAVIIHPSYWALIFGNLVSAAVYTGGSYIIHTYRPRLSLRRLKTQWSFSQWVLLKSLFGYARAQIDVVLVSRMFSMADVGRFHMAKHLTSIPAQDIISPALEPMLSAFSISKKSDPGELPQRFRVSLILIAFFITPLCFFMWHYPSPIIDVLLGSQWTDSHPILSGLSLLLFSMALNQFLEFYCISQARVKGVFFLDVISVVIIASVLVLFPGDSMGEFALHRGLVGIATALIFLCYVNYWVLHFSMPRLLVLYVPIPAAAVAALILTDALTPAIDVPVLLELIYLTGLYFSLYVVLSALIYGLLYRGDKDLALISAFIKPIILARLARLRAALGGR